MALTHEKKDRYLYPLLCGYGVKGRRMRLKISGRNPCRFKYGYPYYELELPKVHGFK